MSQPPAFMHRVQKLPITKVKVSVLTMFPKVKNNSCGGIPEVSNQEDTLLTSSKTMHCVARSGGAVSVALWFSKSARLRGKDMANIPESQTRTEAKYR